MVRLFEWAGRAVLGGLFLFAGYTKLRSPFLFEMAVDAYRLLPPWGVIVVARSLPWLEIALGVLLLAGWMLRYTSSFTALLLGFFVATMAITYSRGVEASCGCFGFGEPISPKTLARDSVLVLLAVFLAGFSWRKHRKQLRETPHPSETPAS